MAIQIARDQVQNTIIDSSKLANSAVTPAKADLSSVWAFTALPSVNSDPSGANDLCRKSYVDSLVQGLHWKESCRVRSASNVNLASPGTTIDGITMASSDRVLLSAQSSGTEDGIYEYNGAASAMTRAADSDTFQKLNGAACFIREGTSANAAYTQTAELTGFGSQSWALFSATAGGRQAGTALSLSSNTLNVEFDDSTIGVNGSDALVVKASGIGTAEIANSAVTNAKLANSSLTVSAGSGLSGGGAIALGGSASLAIQLDGSSLAVGGSGIKIADDGVTSSAIADAAVLTAHIADGNVVLDKLANLSSAQILVGSAGNRPAAVSLSGDASLANSGALTISNAAISTDKVANAAITNAKLASSALTVTAGNGLSGGGSIALGGSGSIAVDLDGSTLAVSGTGLKVADNGIGGAQIGAGVIVASHLASSAVETAKINNLAVTGAKVADDTLGLVKMSFRAAFESFTGSTATKYDLGNAVNSNFRPKVAVYRNGLRCKFVASSPSDSSEYSVADDGTGSITAITFGAAPNGDSIMVDYLY